MAKRTGTPSTLTIRSEAQRQAMGSPLRLELIGLFIEREPLSVAQIARRMGRPASAIHYHVRILEKAGLLHRVGERRAGSRREALYRPVATTFEMEMPGEANTADPESTTKTISMAFRMALGDMKASFEDSSMRTTGPRRNFYGARFHCRLTTKELTELNRHLRQIEKMLSRHPKTPEPSPKDTFISLTLALMPLRNREVRT